MRTTLATAAFAAAALLGASQAQAAHVSWSIGINLPVPVIAAPVYAPVPVYSQAPIYAEPAYAPVPIYAPAPVYAPAVVYYYPRHRVWARPVVYPSYGYGHGRHRGHRGW